MMQMKVAPDLDQIVAAAREARISIAEIQFVRSLDSDVLEALHIQVDGNDECKGYFSWLLEKGNLKAHSIA